MIYFMIIIYYVDTLHRKLCKYFIFNIRGYSISFGSSGVLYINVDWTLNIQETTSTNFS